MHIKHIRKYHANNTTGRIIVDGVEIGSTLEDIGRPTGIKIPAETCIPEGSYFARVTRSPKFKRDMILLYSNPKTLACDLGGVEFVGIRVHPVTTTAHTDGCIGWITASGDLAALESLIKKAGTATWEIARE